MSKYIAKDNRSASVIKSYRKTEFITVLLTISRYSLSK